ncbi:hypothetical protein AVEN_56730-1, partial [Araneus ventricosus]
MPVLLIHNLDVLRLCMVTNCAPWSKLGASYCYDWHSKRRESFNYTHSNNTEGFAIPVQKAAKEHLTNENRPCGECAICLYGFSEDDVFTKTECYHYFHSHCLARYVKNAAISESNDETNHSDTPSDKK